MNRLSLSIASLVALAVFCATLTYWVITLTAPAPLPSGATDARPPVTVDAAARLFGDDQAQDTRIRLSGILSLGAGRGAAAIVSVDGGPAHAIAIGQTIGADGSDMKLAEVRAHSIVIDHGGARSEVSLATPVAGAPGGSGGGIVYMR